MQVKISSIQNPGCHFWLDLDEVSELDAEKQIAQWLAGTKDEDGKIIEDFEEDEHWRVSSNDSSMRIGDDWSLGAYYQLVEFIDEHDEDLASHILDCVHDMDDFRSYMDDNYQGSYSSAEDFAEQFLEEIGDLKGLPDLIRNNIDWESIANDLSHDYVYVDGGKGIHVVRNA